MILMLLLLCQCKCFLCNSANIAKFLQCELELLLFTCRIMNICWDNYLGHHQSYTLWWLQGRYSISVGWVRGCGCQLWPLYSYLVTFMYCLYVSILIGNMEQFLSIFVTPLLVQSFSKFQQVFGNALWKTPWIPYATCSGITTLWCQ